MKISVFSLFRDSEPHLHDSLTRFHDMLSLQSVDIDFYFYENDSKDNTREIIYEWTQEHPVDFYHEDLNLPKFGSVTTLDRLILLSYYRNRLKRLVGKVDSDYCLLVDSDIVYDNSNIEMLINESNFGNEEHDQWAMITPNIRQSEIPDLVFGLTDDSFYDVFATRDRYFNDCMYFSDCPLMLESDRNRWSDGKPVEVASAFGGLALVNSNAYNHSEWSTIRHSEHVNFCRDISRFGPICIVPNCRTHAIVDKSMINYESFYKTADLQRQIMKQVNEYDGISRSIRVSKKVDDVVK